eukprot:10870494-Alexandrium_andersonii.AAC.1
MVDENHFGFRPGRQAQEHVFVLKQATQKSMEYSTGLCIMQADVKRHLIRYPIEQLQLAWLAEGYTPQ